MVEIVLPPRDDDLLSEVLRKLTSELNKVPGTDAFSDGLGGTFGYGANFENSTFLLHRYCWCSLSTCPWCTGCTCPDSAYHFFIDSKEVPYKEWDNFYILEVYGRLDYKIGVDPLPKNWEELSDKINSRRTTTKDDLCSFCKEDLGILKRFTRLPKGLSAPNFWHKESGLMVWWYKYIGRDSKVLNPKKVNYLEILDSCLKSLT